MLRLLFLILVASLVAAATGCSGGADIGKGYNSNSGDLGDFILRSAPKFGVRILTTNGLPHIRAKWRYREASNEFELFVEGDYFPQLDAFLTQAVGPPPGPPTTNSPTELRSIEAYYGTNFGATVCCRREKADNGKQYTSIVIVTYGRPTSDQANYLKSLLELAAKGNDPDIALDAARSSAPYLSDFLRLFPKAEVRYGNFDASLGFDVTVDLYERYQLTMQLPAVFDSSLRNVIGYGEPRFYLWEAASVKRNKSGIAETTLNPAGERRFGSAEWKKIVERAGDFGAIGYAMITNQPVPGFKGRGIAK